MIELSMNKIGKYFGATQVLNDISFEVQTGEKVGIVGCNGSGKSTILKMISEVEEHDGGTISMRKGATIGYLDQIPNYPQTHTVAEVLEEAYKKLYQISSQMKQLEQSMSILTDNKLKHAMDDYSHLQQIFELEGGYEIEEQMSKVCTGLKIDEALRSQLFSTLSGGEKTTVILGKILLQKVDIMLLDEPSNHLDMESIEWLEDYLTSYDGTVLIVSHDRYFLDRVATKIIEIEDMDSTTYMGNYSAYVKTKELNLMLQFEAYKDQQKKIHAMEKAVKELRDWGNRSGNEKFYKRAVSIEKRLEKVVRIEKPKLEKDSMRLNFVDTTRSGKDVIIVEDLCKSFEEKELFKNANLLVRHGERTALIGRNGSGKSTLIKLLTGEHTADSGNASLGASIKLGYLPQNVEFENEDHTILDAFRSDVILTEGKSREYLAKFMFYGESVFKKVRNISGGERSRLKLAMLMYNEINLLILDEPTNHLDIEAMEALEETLKEFNGTIFFISHDRYFINAISSRIVEIRDCSFTSYNGNYDDYHEVRLANENSIREKKPFIKPVKTTRPKNTTVAGLDSKQQNGLESLIEELEADLADIDSQMQMHSNDHTKLNELFMQRATLQQQLDKLLEEWVAIS